MHTSASSNNIVGGGSNTHWVTVQHLGPRAVCGLGSSDSWFIHVHVHVCIHVPAHNIQGRKYISRGSPPSHLPPQGTVHTYMYRHERSVIETRQSKATMYMYCTYLFCIQLFLPLEYRDEVIQLWLGEGVPLDRAVCVVSQNQFAVPVCHAAFKDDL